MTLSSMASSLLRLHSGTDDHVAARSTRNRTLDRDQMTLGVDLDHFEIDRRTIHVAHLAGHLLARKHAARRLALADRARRAVRQRIVVRRGTHREVMAFDRALKALALADTGHVDLLTNREQLVRFQLTADCELAEIARFDAELPKATTGLDLCLRVVPGVRLVDQRSALRARSDLD